MFKAVIVGKLNKAGMGHGTVAVSKHLGFCLDVGSCGSD